MAMNIPLPKNEIMEILNLSSMPRNWKRNGCTMSTVYGSRTFQNGFAMSMLADGVKKFLEMHPNTEKNVAVEVMFTALNKAAPALFIKLA